MTGERLHDLIRNVPIPDERGAEERGWRVVRAAYGERSPAVRAGRRATRVAIAVALGALALAVALTPAGAKVADLVHDIVRPGERNAEPELTSLPAPGALLVTSPSGVWVVSDDGAKRRLGDYQSATWSPNGLYVAVTASKELTAVEPDGTVRWSLSANKPVSDPAWAPSGFRVAYRAGSSVRVVAGDGTGDRLMARHAASTPPAWAPTARRNVLTFVGRDGRIRAVDVDTRRTLWHSPPFGGGINSLEWSSFGQLLVISRSFIVTLNRHGRAVAKSATGGRVEAAAVAPNGTKVALTRRTRTGSELALVTSPPMGLPYRDLFSGPGRFTDVAWSPDGSWILLGWRDADQWLFIRASDGKVDAVSDISRQFAPGARGGVGFPRLAGWTRTAAGGG